MKKILLTLIAFAFLITACNHKGKEVESPISEISEPVVQTPKTDVIETKPDVEIKRSASSLNINEIVNGYLQLKNALVNDNSKETSSAAEKLIVTLNGTNAKILDSNEKKNYRNMAANMNENAKQISGAEGKIDQQRKYFALLSKDIADLIKTFGTNQKIYKDYCPMYDQGKSGYWISETKEIKNPYYGSEMLSCGGIVETLN